LWTTAFSKIVLTGVCPVTESPVPHAHLHQIFPRWLKLPQLEFSHTSTFSASWFKKRKPYATIQFLHSEEMSQQPQSFYFCHHNYVQFILPYKAHCSSYTIIVNTTLNHFIL
jgi:hypothetical protein